MKRLASLLLPLLVVSILLGGCVAGQIARDHTAAPVLKDVTPRVVADAAAAPSADKAVLDKFQAAVDAKDWVTSLALWPQVRDMAKAGIEARVAAGTIGPTVAESLSERLTQYDALLRKNGAVSP